MIDYVKIDIDYEKLYHDLGIKYESLPVNYTPEEFGKQLMEKFIKIPEVTYATDTTIIKTT